VQSRIKRLVFGAFDEKAGAVGSVWDLIRDYKAMQKIEVVSGILGKECAEIITEFFEIRRK
jgi:tRNA(adenine34) deaminase